MCFSVSDVMSVLSIVDGSGGIDVKNIKGGVTVSDGSGSIDIVGVGKDLTIKESGSGSVRIDDVQGRVIR